MAAGASDTLLEASGLHVAYGKVEAVRDISLKVERGTIVSVIGPNGAGKTTLLAALMGLLPATGDLKYLGAPANALTVEQRVARGLILVPERRELFAAMSVADNLELGGFQRARSGERSWRDTVDEVYQRFPRLKERRDQLAGTLSGGERQMLAMGRALMGKPRLLMLDEPSLGLAPLMVREIFSIVAGLRSTGRFDPAGRAERAGGAAGFGLRLRAGDGRPRARRTERRPCRESARGGDLSGQEGRRASVSAFRTSPCIAQGQLRLPRQGRSVDNGGGTAFCSPGPVSMTPAISADRLSQAHSHWKERLDRSLRTARQQRIARRGAPSPARTGGPRRRPRCRASSRRSTRTKSISPTSTSSIRGWRAGASRKASSRRARFPSIAASAFVPCTARSRRSRTPTTYRLSR